MNEGKLQTVRQVRKFLEGSEAVEFRGLTAKEKYYWIEGVLIRFKYHLLKRDGKGVIRRYIEKVTGYPRSQVSRADRGVQRERAIKEDRIQKAPVSVEVYPVRN